MSYLLCCWCCVCNCSVIHLRAGTDVAWSARRGTHAQTNTLALTHPPVCGVHELKAARTLRYVQRYTRTQTRTPTHSHTLPLKRATSQFPINLGLLSYRPIAFLRVTRPSHTNTQPHHHHQQPAFASQVTPIHIHWRQPRADSVCPVASGSAD